MLLIEKEVLANFESQVWMQPNQVALTIFPKDQSIFPELTCFLQEMPALRQARLQLLRHVDAIDILPAGIDKGKAMLKLFNIYGYESKEVIAIGDAFNDVPMLEQAFLPLVVHEQIYLPGARHFSTIREALVYVEEQK